MSGRATMRPNATVESQLRTAPRERARRRDAGAVRAQVAGIQRSRLLAAATRAVEELGDTQVTVADITRRARVSRRTFYELFANRDACLAAVLDDALQSVEAELAAADIAGLSWRERLRAGLWTILEYFDREPELARVCVVQSLRGDRHMLERRAAVLARLAAVVDEGRFEGTRGQECSPFTAEGLVGAAFAVVHTRLVGNQQEPLGGLLGELMGLIVLPYLGPAAARREQARPVPVTDRRARSNSKGRDVLGRDPLAGIPMRLTYRTARVLQAIGARPGISNREVAERAGVVDAGQISKLLARLERLDLIANSGEGHTKGEPNAWALTSLGTRVADAIHTHARYREAA